MKQVEEYLAYIMTSTVTMLTWFILSLIVYLCLLVATLYFGCHKANTSKLTFYTDIRRQM